MKNEILSAQQSTMLAQPERTVAFTGYRPSKLPYGCSASVQHELTQLLEEQIRACYERGYRFFLNGCMSGWDILAAETILKMRISMPDLCCITVAPFRKSFFGNSNWTPEWKERALIVYRYSNCAFSLAEQNQRGIYHIRDRYLVDHASLLLAYYDGKPGGTKYTIDYAVKKQLEIINIAPLYQDYLNARPGV